MTKSKLASWIVAAVLIGGSGMAFAETAAPEPETVQPAPEGEEGGEEGGEKAAKEQGARKDNHGAVVSAAAKDHTHDEACGNHGKVVSAVAKTGRLPECATGQAPAEGGDKSEAKASKPAKKASKSAKGGKK